MAVTKRKSLPVDTRLLQRARRLLKSASDVEAVRQALEEAIANREVEQALTKLIREGRGRFVDVYEDRS
jgi:endonuclease III